MSTPADVLRDLPLAAPAGMRDFIYPESAARTTLAAALVSVFERHGYDLVTTPPFELAAVVERAMETAQRQDLLRFVDPQSGDVAVLRSDFTPQIARLVAAHMSERPLPWRLAYSGTVVRHRRNRARKHRQIEQVGVECIGESGVSADAAVIGLCADAVVTTGLERYSLELNQVSIGNALLDDVPERARRAASDALLRKDGAELGRVLKTAGANDEATRALTALPTLYGDVSVFDEAERVLRNPAAKTAIAELRAVWGLLEQRGLGARLLTDLGDLRGMAYYTGVSFAVLAEGPGEPVGNGGRYDNLLARFDAPAPATGFAIDLTNLLWALEQAKRAWEPARPARIVVTAEGASVAEAMRKQGVVVAPFAGSDAHAFAEAWRYDAILAVTPTGMTATRMDGASRNLAGTEARELDALAKWAKER